MKTIYAIALCFWLFVPLVPVAAHGSGTTLEEVSGDYVIEFEYDKSAPILAGDHIKYNVFLVYAGDHRAVEFEDAFIQIQNKEERTVFAGRISQEPGIDGYSSFTLALVEPGSYQSEVVLLSDGKEIASGSFKYEVEENEGEDKVLIFSTLLFLSGLITGGVFGYLFNRKK